MPKRSEGVEALIQEDRVSIQEITMLDWYAGFALMARPEGEDAAKRAFDLAAAMMKERRERLWTPPRT